MDVKNTIALLEWVKEKILNSGANECSVGYVRNNELEIEFRKGKIETLQKSISDSLSISIYKNNKFSIHSTTSLDKDDLEKFIARGINMTEFLNRDKFRTLPDPKYYRGKEKINLELFDNSINHVTMNEKTDALKKIEHDILNSGKNIVSATIGYSDITSELMLINSNGFFGEKKSTLFSSGAEITVKDKNGELLEDGFFAIVRNLSQLPNTGDIANKALEFTIRKSGQKKIESGKYEVIVENRVAGNLLKTIISPLSGKMIYLKKSYLEDKEHTKIGSDALNISDMPFTPGKLGSRLFDGEGITSRPRIIVSKGILKDFYIDSYYAKKLKREPTSGSYSNIVIPSGEKTSCRIISEMKRGILITGFIGGNFNTTTGDFSFGITGILIEDGQLKQAVNEMNITGNSSDLWNNFLEAADNPFEFSRIITPSIRFSELQFSGS